MHPIQKIFIFERYFHLTSLNLSLVIYLKPSIMKKTVLFLLAMLASGALFSQIVLMTENMDSYATSSFLGVDNPTWFTTWSNLPGSGEDAQILTNYAHSGTKSASADLTGGQTDCILKLGDKTSGRYELKWWMYVENGKCGYYNIQHFQTPGVEWAYEVYFRTNGDIHLYRGTTIFNGTYPKATWFEVKQIVKIDVDSVYLYINGTLLTSWPFHWTSLSTTGTNRLGGVDLFAGEEAASGEIAGYYFDDVSYSQLGTLPPTVVTQAATGVTSTQATLNGTVNANIQSTTVTFQYGLTTAYGTTVPGVPATVTGSTVTPVTANLTGLLPGNTYHYKVCGVNSIGTTCGVDMTFTTPAILPAVITVAATNITNVTATLNGTVDAGGASTTVTFDYGLTTAYGTTVPGVPPTVTGNGATPVIANISGLILNTTYHYRVNGVNSVGTTNGTDMSFITTLCPYPGPPGTITGPVNGCGNTPGNVYTVTPIVNATGYVWTIPPGAVITAGANTNSITVTLGNSSGTVTVHGTNTCGDGPISSLAVTVNQAPVPTITGQNSMCVNSGYYNYSTQPGFTNYTWTVSAGGTITFGAGTSTIQVTWNTAGAQTVSVNYTNLNGCSAFTPTVFPVTVTGMPSAAGTITGTSAVCGGAAGVVYSVAPIANTTVYVWSFPAGVNMVGGFNTNTVTVNFAANASSGNVTVYGNNPCGSGATSPPFPVTVTPLVAAAGEITGPASVCQGMTGVVYSVAAVANATSYTWSVPSGATITSGGTTNTITVDFSASASSGPVSVYGSNSCGNGASSAMNITLNPVPAAPVITSAGSDLTSNAPSGNQWYFSDDNVTGVAIPGATGQTLSTTKTGWYWDEVTLNGCESGESNHLFMLFVGVDNISGPGVSIYPVPNDGRFSVSITSASPDTYSITVMNNLGMKIRELKEVDVTGTLEKVIDLRPVPDGLYTVIVQNSTNKVVKKILVNK